MKYQHLIVFILSVCLLAGCSTNGSLPAEAQKVVEEAVRSYYTSPWQGNIHFDELTKIEITQAWRAKDLDDDASSGELWCLEVAVSGKQANTPQDVAAVWIAVHQEDPAAWQAAALETISASVTIEQCQK